MFPIVAGDLMAFDAYDDYEQGEQVRQWLRANAASILLGIVLGLLLIFGWQQWRAHQQRYRMAAAEQYQVLQQALQDKDGALATAATERLMKDYPDTIFATFAAAGRAEHAASAGQYAQAVTALDWAEQHAGDAALKHLFELRLAQLELAQGQPAAALARLDKLPAGTYVGMTQALRGDALLALKRPAEARTAYAAALAAFKPDAPERALVQMKFDDLATAGKQGS